jgi:PPP family 3-phenylpropionic acid transporter
MTTTSTAASTSLLNRPTIVARATYFCLFGAGAALFPFLVIFYKSLGISVERIGWLTGLATLTGLLAGPAWGALADATHAHRLILQLGFFGVIGMTLVLAFTRQFVWLIPVIVALSIASSPIIPLIDNGVVKLLGERKDRYGQLRLWGSVGWGIVAPAVGWLVQSYGLRLIFYTYVVLMAACLVFARQLPSPHPSTNTGYGRGLRALLTQPAWLLFLAVVFVGGISMAIVNSFLFLYLSELKASATLMGVSMTVATLSEVPIMYYAARLLRRWGPGPVLIVAFLLFGVRMLAYSFAHAPWLVVLIQLLNGPTFAAAWVAGVSLANQMAPEGLGATAQSMFSSTLMGLGGTAGAVMGGWLYDHAGSAAMFQISGVSVIIGTLVYALVMALLTNRAVRHAELSAPIPTAYKE